MSKIAYKLPPDKNVIERTGKSWNEWFAVLNKFGKEKGHTALAKHLQEKHKVDLWYSQEITVQFERFFGLRKVLERKTGYAVTVQRTINCTVEKAWAAVSTGKGWNKWFSSGTKISLKVGGRYSNDDNDTGEILKVVPNKLLCFTWEQKMHKPGSIVTITVLQKGEKCTVGLEHTKIKLKREADELKAGGWVWAMDSLKWYLETGKGIGYEAWKAARKR